MAQLNKSNRDSIPVTNNGLGASQSNIGGGLNESNFDNTTLRKKTKTVKMLGNT